MLFLVLGIGINCFSNICPDFVAPEFLPLNRVIATDNR